MLLLKTGASFNQMFSANAFWLEIKALPELALEPTIAHGFSPTNC